MDLEWFWFLLSWARIFPSCNGGWTGGPGKALSLEPCEVASTVPTPVMRRLRATRPRATGGPTGWEPGFSLLSFLLALPGPAPGPGAAFPPSWALPPGLPLQPAAQAWEHE